MDPLERIEIGSLVDLQVLIAEGDISTKVEAVGEPQEDGFDGESGDGRQQEAGARRNEPPQGMQLVRMRTSSRSLAMARWPTLLDPLWAPYQDQWKLAPHKPSGIQSPLLRFPRNYHM